MNDRDLIFPSREAWQGNIRVFRPLLMGRTECPEPFAFAAALAAISMVAGRDVVVNYGNIIRLNLFILLVGMANNSHKGLPINIAHQLLKTLVDFNFKLHLDFVRAIDSGEGFIESLPKSRQALVLMDEIVPIFRKGNAKASTIQTTLINAYDGAELGRGTVKTKIRISDHFITMLAGSNPGLISDNLRNIDAESGLLGRFSVFYGERKTRVPWPNGLDIECFRKAVITFNNIFFHYHNKNHELVPTPEAKQYWDKAYNVLLDEIERNDDLITQEMWKRLHLNIIKIAGLLAVAELRDEITKSDLERASTIGNYIGDSAVKLREFIGKTIKRGIDDRIIAHLEKVGKCSRRHLQQHVRGKDVDAAAFASSLNSLTYSGAVEEDPETCELYIPGSTLQHSTEKEASGEKP